MKDLGGFPNYKGYIESGSSNRFEGTRTYEAENLGEFNSNNAYLTSGTLGTAVRISGIVKATTQLSQYAPGILFKLGDIDIAGIKINAGKQ
jgi:hypothetical protein